MRRRSASAAATAVAFLALAATASAARAQEETYGEVTVRVLPGVGGGQSHGYLETAFAVSNAGDTPRRVTLALPASVETSGRRQALERLERTVLVGPRAEARVTLLQPPVPVAGSGLEVRVDGRPRRPILPLPTPEHPLFWSLHSSGGSAGGPVPRVLFASRFQLADFGVADTDLTPVRSEIPEAAWSEAWLAYGGWDGIVVSGEGLAAAPPGVRDALRRATAAGGNVAVFGGPPGLLLGEDRQPDLVRGQVSVFFEGFGRVLTAPSVDTTDLAPLREAWSSTLRPWVELSDPSALLASFPVRDGLTVPVRGLVIAIVGLTLLMGPVNVGYLRHVRRPLWIFWTVPALAFLACLTVLVWALASEGLQRLSRTAALTLLDQRTHDATTVAYLAFYSTLDPGPLVFDAATELTPMIQLGWSESAQTARRIDWSEGQRLTSGWVSPRLPAGFVLRKSEPRRERLEVRREGDGRLTATNGLGADLVELWVADAGGRLHRAESPVGAGRTVALAPTSVMAGGRRAALGEVFGATLPHRLGSIRGAPGSTLWAGTYLAALEAAPFVEPGLAESRGGRAESLVLGILGAEI